jgi:hypothetical protein
MDGLPIIRVWVDEKACAFCGACYLADSTLLAIPAFWSASTAFQYLANFILLVGNCIALFASLSLAYCGLRTSNRVDLIAGLAETASLAIWIPQLIFR